MYKILYILLLLIFCDAVISKPIDNLTNNNPVKVQVNIPSTSIPRVLVPLVELPQVKIINVEIETILPLVKLWQDRYSRQIDFYDERGNILVPMPGTVLWAEQNSVIEAIKNGGDYDFFWNIYNEHFQRAVGRRMNLNLNKKKR